jgi:hypothetical protein
MIKYIANNNRRVLILNGRFPMSIKKMFILIMVVLVPSISLGMEGDPSSLKYAKVDDGAYDSDDFELSPDDNFECWLFELQAYFGNFDVTGVRAQLACSEVEKLSDKERDSLCAEATKRSELISTMCRAAQEITQYTTNEIALDKFTFREYLKQAKQIEHLLHAVKLIKKFKFPQVHFTPRPYSNDPRPSLDSILETLIMNEQKGISVCCFHITLYNIAERLVDQKNEGVQIELVTNQTQGDTAPLQGLKHMIDNGISLMTPRNRSYEMNHHKFFIFTSNVLSKPLVCYGSYNPTGCSNVNSWDDITILDDAGVIQDFRNRFEEIKAASQPIIQEALANARTNPSSWSLSNNNVPDELRK